MRRGVLWITAVVSSRRLRLQSHGVAAANAFSASAPSTTRSSTSSDMSSCSSATSGRPDALGVHLERIRSDKNEVLILDGGTGEELFRRGVPDDRKIWSATAVVNEKHHRCLRDVHKSFIDAGSDAITSNSYGITPGVGFSREDLVKYVGLAGLLARQSINEDGKSVVCGSLGPLVESYRPDLVSEHAEGVEFYKLMATALAPNVDCLLAETMSSVEESTQAVEAVGSLPSQIRRPLMVSYTLNSAGKIRSGESVLEAIPKVLRFAGRQEVDLIAVLFNCAEPEAITKAFEEISGEGNLQQLLQDNDIQLGAYANRLTPVPDQWSLEESEEAQAVRDDLSPPEYYNKFVKKWVRDFGVQLVGGCCGITPEHISYMRSHLRPTA
mmetsp:Transcript_14834/g.31917  ORF Transcript_14834/g.31917 Transcript_14834/m.31917 type:complete len:383 (+) Transcript_14834:358-1506(+)